MPGVSKILCLPGYLQSGATLARKASGLRKTLTKQLNMELDFLSPCHPIPSRHELEFQLGPTDEEADKVWDRLVAGGNNCRWYDHLAPGQDTGLEESIEFVVDHIRNNGPYDGIIGFSQGAAMAIMITNSLRRLLPQHPDFKISMFVSGFCLVVPRDGNFSRENVERLHELTDVAEYAAQVELAPNAKQYYEVADRDHFDTEVVLVYGDNDSVVPPIRSKHVSMLYPEEKVHVFSHEGAHLVPNQKAFVKPVAELFSRRLTGKL
ncbi:uncharacterized protein LODBEIA_P32290 [Lodderomyces beijingensis]|uniref:Serine hydrolase domain-containing protein n=1 Tax=Lodderomyces beijingensis TaxID=1775926 RepID=A0ABP0ZP53_9ASCO